MQKINIAGTNLEADIIADYLALCFHKSEKELADFVLNLSKSAALPEAALQAHYRKKALTSENAYIDRIVELVVNSLNWSHIYSVLLAIVSRMDNKLGN